MNVYGMPRYGSRRGDYDQQGFIQEDMTLAEWDRSYIDDHDDLLWLVMHAEAHAYACTKFSLTVSLLYHCG